MQSISIALNALISCEQYRLLFSVHLKSPKLMDRLQNSVGSEFQTLGPATEKARRPDVILRQRGTISWCWLADRRCRLLAAVTGVQWTLLTFSIVVICTGNNNLICGTCEYACYKHVELGSM